MDAVNVATENRSSRPEAREAMLDVRSGAAVTCGDGTLVGTLAGVVTMGPVPHLAALVRADRATGRVTGLIADVGRRWHTRRILVPAQAIGDLSEDMVLLRATREEVRSMPPADARRRPRHALIPEEPYDVGVAVSEPDSAHVEAARVLADEAKDELGAHGFSEDEIRHWAEAYCREQRSGDLETFLAWIDLREHQS